MYILSEILGVAAELFTYHLFVQGIFFSRKRSAFVYAGVYGLFGGIMLFLSFLEGASFLRLIYGLISFGCIAKLLFEMTFLQMVYTSASFGCLYVLTDVVTIAVGSLLGIDVNIIMSYGNIRAVFIIFTHTFLFLLVMIVLSLTKWRRNAVTLPFLLTITPGCFAGIALGIYFCLSVQQTGQDVPITILIIAAGMLYLNILIVFFAERMQEANQRRHEMELAEQHYRMQEQYYEQLRNDQNETRAMFHDINKYLQAMQALAAEANTQQAQQMLLQAQDVFKGIGNVVNVGNSVVSILLSEYQRKAEENAIAFDFDVSVPEKLGITAIDLYVILGNTLDNAMEACQSLPEPQRFIRLQMRVFHDMLFCQVENPYGQDHEKEKKGKNHGYGLLNVRRSVDKYQGDLSITRENLLFRVSMRLNLTV